MKTVFLPRFDAKHEIKWTRAFLEILKNTHMIGDDSHSIHFMTIQDMQEYVNKKELGRALEEVEKGLITIK